MLYKKQVINKFINLDLSVRYDLSNLKEFFNFHKYELYLVGGCVRDMLLDKTPNDFDLTTNATPEQIKEIISFYGNRFLIYETGIKHGTITVYSPSTENSFEITTYRTDGKYIDGRHPEKVNFILSLEEDLKRRDFTINSLAFDIETEEVSMLDESYLLDIKLKIIRAVGNAYDRFSEDALRMLRAIRFAAQLNGTIETETFNAIKELSKTIEYISEERIREELTKIIISDNPQYLKLLLLNGLDEYILPYLKPMYNVEQKNAYHYTDVLHHSLDVIKALPKEEVMLRWAALFHDIGKVDTVSYDQLGQEHHYEHERFSVSIAERYMEHLKFDNKTKNDVLTIIQNHGHPLENIKMRTLKKLINKVGENLFEKYLLFRQADIMSHAITEQENRLKGLADVKEKYKKIILEKHVMNLSKLAINGRDLLELGFEGKEIGIVLNKCLGHVLENPEDNRKDILIKVLQNN